MKAYLTQFLASRYWNYALVSIFVAGIVLTGYGSISLFTGLKEQTTRTADTTPSEANEVLDLATLNTATESSRPKQEKGIQVYISGAVKKPGVYSLQANARVSDGIELAGGFSSKADGNQIAQNLNLAEKLQDAQHIYVPSLGESHIPDSASTSYLKTASTKINVNIASESELESLTGVGPVTAKKIVEARPYTSFQDFVKRANISSRLAEQIQGEITLSTQK
jgi:competence protein ComEA